MELTTFIHYWQQLPTSITDNWLWVALLFIWSGFVRSGLGFGGMALTLPMLLIIDVNLLFWVPVIGLHLLFFSTLTLYKNHTDIDWHEGGKLILLLLIPKILGIIGLISLPSIWLALIVYLVTAYYSIQWILARELISTNCWRDTFLLVIGGYVSGVSLIGAPLITAVAINRIAFERYRATLFMLWSVLVTIKLLSLYMLNIELNINFALLTLPFATIGHFIGLYWYSTHLKTNPIKAKRIMGAALLLLCIMGLVSLL